MAGQIFDRLVQRLGKKSLFIDLDNIPFGGDFRRHIDDALKSSDLLIALVGPRWAGGVDELRAKRDGVVAYLQSCLGKHWARKRTNFQNGATDTKFTLGSDEPVPHIRESIYTDGRGNILRIEVDVPSSLIRQAPAEAVSEQPAPHRRRTRRNRPTRPEPIAKT